MSRLNTLLSSRRFMLFPLFLAGIESTSEMDKKWVGDTLARFEENSLGPNIRMTNQLLREIYRQQERHQQRLMLSHLVPQPVSTIRNCVNNETKAQGALTGFCHEFGLDWVDFMQQNTCRFIIYDI
jgi:hypothetical protein